jgi:glycosyltransferase involved in cell wall biosynthesis
LRIGIAALSSIPGQGGGLDIYTRQLVEALAVYPPGFDIVVLVSTESLPYWTGRKWPAHVSFIELQDLEPRRSLLQRAGRHLRRELRLATPPEYGEPYLARQIDEIGLSLVHYPGTVIRPLSLKLRCLLGFADLQQEYYPEYFTKAELEWRAGSYRASVDKAIHVIAPSSYTRDSLIAKYGTPADKISVIPYGIPQDLARRRSDEIERVHLKYGLPAEYVYYPANPWPHKNHARLMAALRIVHERWGETPWLVLTGRLADERRDALSMAIAAGVEERVLDLGFIPSEDLPALYSAASALVFPSLFEGFGLPLIEAMACGCPIVAAESTAIPEITGGAALLFDPLQTEQIAGAIHRVMTDEELRTHLVKEGLRFAEGYRWPRIISRLVQVYNKVGTLGANRSQ